MVQEISRNNLNFLKYFFPIPYFARLGLQTLCLLYIYIFFCLFILISGSRPVPYLGQGYTWLTYCLHNILQKIKLKETILKVSNKLLFKIFFFAYLANGYVLSNENILYKGLFRNEITSFMTFSVSVSHCFFSFYVASGVTATTITTVTKVTNITKVNTVTKVNTGSTISVICILLHYFVLS